MQVYLYAKSGHTVGLEATKRCAAIANALKDFNPILCTSDFRAGAFAKEHLEVKKYVNVDVLRNLTNLMQRNDILIYDSEEENEQMKQEIKDFCSLSYKIGVDIQKPIVDTSIYSKVTNPNLEKTIFFGDDDYENLLISMTKDSNKFDLNLLMGHYFFLGNEKIFKNSFLNIIDEEDYVQTIQNSKFLLTSSLQSAFESIACGNKPVLFKREDKILDLELINKFDIPVLEYSSFEELINKFEELIENYPSFNCFKFTQFEEIILEVKTKIEIFNKLTQI
jgi:hypothetical protein